VVSEVRRFYSILYLLLWVLCLEWLDLTGGLRKVEKV
jgi:hypothetical protein